MKPLADLATVWSSLSPLLDEALALTGEQRSAWLDALRLRPGVSAALHIAVQDLLGKGAGVETGDFMSTLPRLGAAASAATPALQAGTTIGPYRLVSELGHGGMGAVWLAERADGAFARQVALKLPLAALLTRMRPDLAARFRRERDILARLEHPHVARFYDAGIAPDGLPYLAMELVDGVPIDTYCDRRRLTLRERIALFGQVLAAVQYAHANLVIHRDIKPDNLLVTPQGQVRLLDFGIAKLLDDDSRAPETALTQMAGRALTPAFASPEQIKGEALTTASDVYSLGVVLYVLLTGRRPYRLELESAAQLEQAIIGVEAPRPSSVAGDEAAAARGTSARGLAKALAGDLDTILLKALAKAPAERYETAAAFAQDLDSHLGGQPIAARPAGAWLRLAKLVRRNRLASGALATVVLALAAGMGASLWQAHEAREQARFAQQAAGRHEGVRNFYSEVLTPVAGWDTATFGQPGAIAKLVGLKVDELEPQYKDKPAAWAGILNAASALLNFLGEPEQALQLAERELAALENTRADLRGIVFAHMSISRNAGLLGRHEHSETVLRRALARIPESDDAEIGSLRLAVLSDLGQTLVRLERRGDARAAFEQGRVFAQRQRLVNRNYALLLQNLGNLHAGFDSRSALAVLEESNRVYQGDAETEGADLSLNRVYLGSARLELGQLDEAERELRAAHAKSLQDYGPADRQTFEAAGALAWTLVRAERYADGEAVLAAALAPLRDSTEPRHLAMRAGLLARRVQSALTVGDLAAAEGALQGQGALDTQDPQVGSRHLMPLARTDLLLLQGKPREAGELLARFRATLVKRSRPHERFATALAEARVQRAGGDAAGAAQSTSTLLVTMGEAGVGATWTHLMVHEWAALTAAEAGDAARARSLLQAAAALLAQLSVPSRVEQADSELRRAQAWQRLGDGAQAQTLAQAALARLSQQHDASPRLTLARSLARPLAQGR